MKNLDSFPARHRNSKVTDLCQSIESVYDTFGSSRFIQDLTGSDEQSLSPLKKFFGLKEAWDLVILCYFIEKKLSNDPRVSFSRAVKHFQLSLADCQQLSGTLELLSKKHLIVPADRNYRNNEKEYVLSQNCFTAILTCNRKLIRGRREVSMASFLKEFDTIVSNRKDYPEDELMGMLFTIIDDFSTVEEIGWLRQQKFSRQDEVLMCLAIRSYILYDQALEIENAVKVLANDSFSRYQLQKELLSGKNRLIREEYLVFDIDFFAFQDMKLSARSLAGMCSFHDGVKKPVRLKMLSLLSPESLPDEPYLHENAELKQIEQLVNRENYEKIRSRVTRLTVLLTGAPGVGKTSFVNQLAKKCDRPILTANIAGILSSFVGESEKNIVQLFKEAEMAYREFEVTPIIIFDEAESLLYSRHSKSGSAVDQMSNNIISLLLMCLDKFRGILICCSNFDFSKGRFDPALHRRFHSVVQLKSPSRNVLKSIFNHYFPNTEEMFVDSFLNEYQFITPSQIRNLSEKLEIRRMFCENSKPEELLREIAENDLAFFVRNQSRSIGYSLPN